jgi:hypothetical protein
MPDNDPLDPLDNFAEGLHVNSLPASEVRRRGDRMRRRNTALATVGGVVAAAVFIGTPVALLAGDDDKGTVDPADPSPSVTEDSPPRPAWLTEIPAGFPLTDGFPETNGLDGSPTTVVDNPALTTLQLCGTGWPTGGSADVAGISYTGESEDTRDRTLLLLEDDLAATTALDALEEAVQACPNQPTSGGDSVLESSLVDLDLGTEQSVVVAQQVRQDDGLLSQLTVTEVARSGNAIFVESSYGSAAGPAVVDFETQRLRERSARPLGAMCLFSAEPCTISSGEASDPAPGAPSSDSAANPAIPAGFPLDRGMGQSTDATDTAVAPPIDLCGTAAWEPDGVAERMGVRRTDIELVEARELVTFSSTLEATDAVDSVRQAVSACRETTGDNYSGHTTAVLRGDTGFDSFTWGAFDATGAPSGWTFQLTRVGSAVLVLYSEGEKSESSLQPSADAQTGVTRDLAPEMCLWTQAGC